MPDNSVEKKHRFKRGKVSLARITAFEILFRVETEGAFAAPLLDARSGRLSQQDKRLVYELTLGVLRKKNLSRLDYKALFNTLSKRSRSFNSFAAWLVSIAFYDWHNKICGSQ